MNDIAFAMGTSDGGGASAQGVIINALVVLIFLVILFIIVRDIFKRIYKNRLQKTNPNVGLTIYKKKRFTGLLILGLSFIWSLFLLFRVKSFLDQKFLMLSGSNLFDAKGIELSEGTHILLWLIAVTGLCVGLWLVINSFESVKDIFSNTFLKKRKKCPMCAELVMEEAKICKHCGHKFV